MKGWYIGLLLLLSPLHYWGRKGLDQAEFLLPLSLIFTFAVLLTLRQICSRKEILVSQTDAGVMLWMFIWGISVLRVPADRMEPIYFQVYLCGFLLYFVFRNLVFAGKNRNYLLYTFIGAAFLQAVFTCRQQTGNFDSFLQLKGSFIHSALLAGFFTIGITAIVYVLQIKKNPKENARQKRYFRLWQSSLILAGILFIYLLYKTGSRAAWLATFGGTGYLLIARINRKQLMLVVPILFLLFAGSIHYLYQLKPASANGRVLIWTNGIKMWQSQPVWGNGFGGFRRNYMPYQAAYFDKHPQSAYASLAADNRLSFNEFLKIATEQGATGLLAVCLLIYLALSCKAPDCTETCGIKAILIGIFIFSCFSYPSESLHLHVVTATCFAVLGSIDTRKYRYPIPHLPPGILTTSLLLLLIAGGYWIFLTGRFTAAVRQFQELTQRPEQNPLPELAKLYPQLKNNTPYLFFYGEKLNQAGEWQQSRDIYERILTCFPSSAGLQGLGIAQQGLGQLDAAKEAWQKACRMVPAAMRPHYLLAKLYSSRGDSVRARKHIDHVLNAPLKVYTPEIYYMKKELRKMIINLK